MAQISIPETHFPRIKTFSNLSEEQKDLLFRIISNYPIGNSPSGLTKQLVESLNIEKTDVSDILSVLYSLINALETTENDVESFLQHIKSSLDQSGDSELVDNDEVLRDIEKLLSVAGKNGAYTQYAYNIMSSQTNVYYHSSVVSDVRPVIIKQKDYIGSVLVHQLKILYNYNDEQHETVFSLDEKDVLALISTLNNAIEKSRIIKEKFSDAEFINFK